MGSGPCFPQVHVRWPPCIPSVGTRHLSDPPFFTAATACTCFMTRRGLLPTLLFYFWLGGDEQGNQIMPRLLAVGIRQALPAAHSPCQPREDLFTYISFSAQRVARTFRAVRRRLHTPTSTCTWARRESGTPGPVELNSKEWWCWACRAGTTLLLAHRSESRNVGIVPVVSAALRAESCLRQAGFDAAFWGPPPPPRARLPKPW